MMLRGISTFLSVTLHPLFFPIYGLSFILWADAYKFAGMDEMATMKFFAIIAVNTIAFPLITVLLMNKLGFVSNLSMKEREERIIPFAAGGLFYFWTFMVVRSISVSSFITELFLGASLGVFACFFFNLFFKISAHCIAAGGFVAMTLWLTLSAQHNLQAPLFVIIILAGLLGSARWYLKAHTPFEIFSGYAVGFLSQAIAFKLII